MHFSYRFCCVTLCYNKPWEWKMKSLSRVRLFATPWTEDCQAPPSMGFSRQEYWSGLPFPSSIINPNQEKKAKLFLEFFESKVWGIETSKTTSVGTFESASISSQMSFKLISFYPCCQLKLFLNLISSLPILHVNKSGLLLILSIEMFCYCLF